MPVKSVSVHSKSIIIGLIAGFGGGLASLGGGTLVIPMLMGWLCLTPVAARGTAIVVSVFSSSMGVLMYYQEDMLDLPIAVWVAIPSVFITSYAASWSENWPAERLKTGFGLVVVLGGMLIIYHDYSAVNLVVAKQWQIPYLLTIGVIEGLVAGIVGVSGGPVLAPLFVMGLGMPQQLAQGCSLAARLPAILSGSWENWRLGNIHFTIVPGLATGALIGAWLGSKTAFWMPEHALRTLFAALLVLLGSYYLYQGLFQRKKIKV